MCVCAALFGLWACLAAVAAQENSAPAKPPCIATAEPIYQPGVDGVKPPQPTASRDDKAAPDMRGRFSVELIVNSGGHVCDARVMSAKDRSFAEKAAKYISEHGTFSPATKQAKPVSVKFRMNWSPR